MKRIFPDSLRWMLVPAVLFLIVPKAVQATTWQATVGAQNQDGSKHAMAFLPNELWIHAGDSITWTTKSGEGHTVTFLRQPLAQPPFPAPLLLGQNRPSTAQGCSVIPAAPNTPPLPSVTTNESVVTASGSSFDPSAPDDAALDPNPPTPDTDNTENCINSGSICDRSLQLTPDPTKCPNMPTLTYTVTFPKPGNFKFVCLVHRDMTGVVHVLDPAVSPKLPHDQDFYNDQAAAQFRQLISDTDLARDNDDRDPQNDSIHTVITTGELVATGGGRQYLAIMRFLPSTINVKVGDTVVWTNYDSTEPHTVTFNPAGPLDPNGDPTVGIGVSDPGNDNDLHGTLPNGIKCNPAETVSYCFSPGTIGAALQDQTGQPQPAAARTSVNVTFTMAGEYDYFCTIHDELGMVGKVIVTP